MWPDQFEGAGEVHRCCGSLRFATCQDPPMFWVAASGYIGPRLLSSDLAEAKKFGQLHPVGWDYIADTSGVRLANPLNIFWLRTIPSLANLRRYIVIAPSPIVRMEIRASQWLVRPDLVLRSRDEWLKT